MPSKVAPAGGRPPRVASYDRSRIMFGAMLVGWLLFPALLWGRLAQDAVPLIAAGRVAVVDPAAVYVTSPTDLNSVTPRFHDEACAAMPAGTDCENVIVPFTHTPVVLPLVVVLGKLPTDVAVFVCRLLSAVGLAAGMALLWRRITDRSPPAAPWLAASAVVLTPFAIETITLGQSSAILFLSVCLGVAGTGTTRGAAVRGSVWAATIVMKAFPAALAVVAVVQRRWRLLLCTLAWGVVLLVAAFAIGHGRVFTDFVESTKALRAAMFANTYNRGLDGLLFALFPSWNGDSVAFAASILVRLGVVVALWWAKVRRGSADIQWAFGWIAILWFIPVVWFHYFWIIVGAAFLLAAERIVDDPRWARLPLIVAAIAAVGVLADVQSTVVVVVCGLGLIAILIAFALLTVPAVVDDDEGASVTVAAR